ncbi:MAG: long-chain fatty acid--CoA ligase [Deltaproteobacteria bacterium]|nr:long-chain fatty acid--CoA ligase [Deltaproteobacteria bacterium]
MAKFEETSMGAVFQNRVEKYGNSPLVAYKNKAGVYEDISWNKMNEMVRNLGYFLISKGIKSGDKVALFSPNRYEWWIADLAILSVGAVNVPIYATNSAEESRYIIENSDSKMCFVATKEHMDKILEVKGKLPNLGEIISFDELDTPVPGVITLAEAMKEGSTYSDKEEFDRRIKATKLADLATIIYTSGTTGPPKGVMLSHNNFFSNCNQCYDVDPSTFQRENLNFLSFLPLAHSFERTVGYYLPLFTGKKVYFAEDFAKILENFQEVHPTCIVSVPRLYEKIHAGIVAKVSTAPPVKKALFNWAMGLAKKNLPYVCNDKPRTGLFAFQYNLADKLIFSKLKDALGMDRLEFAFSGGGPLAVTDAEFFLGMGIKVIEGFGLTETTPVVNANKPFKIKPGTVGPAVRDTSERIDEKSGEILIKGPQIMMGYYKNEEATKEAFTDDGYFKTGDIGEFDDEGYLKITGRIKDLIITSGGKNISPQNLENDMKASRFIEQVAVIGDNRKYLSALVVPNFEELEAWAKEQNISFGSRKELIENDAVRKLYEGEIKETTKNYARVEQIRKFSLLESEWSQETDELTPTLKVKRRVINQKYSTVIDDMYVGE